MNNLLVIIIAVLALLAAIIFGVISFNEIDGQNVVIIPIRVVFSLICFLGCMFIGFIGPRMISEEGADFFFEFFKWVPYTLTIIYITTLFFRLNIAQTIGSTLRFVINLSAKVLAL